MFRHFVYAWTAILFFFPANQVFGITFDECNDTGDADYVATECGDDTDLGSVTNGAGGTFRCCTNAPLAGGTGTTGTSSQQGAFSYTPLESLPGSSDASRFPDYVQGIYKFGMWTVGLAALFMITVGGFIYLSSAGNTSTMGTAKNYIWDAIIGLVLAILAWLILNIINPDLVNVNLDRFSQVGGVVPTATQNNTTTPGGGASCVPSPDSFKAALAGGGTVCSGISCDKNCTFTTEVNAAVNSYVPAEKRKVVKALICRESSGDKTATNPVGGVMSCGLMQVNFNEVPGNTSCTGPVKNLFDPATNVQEGLKVFEKKLSYVASLVTPYLKSGTTKEQLAFAAYNCCANGENPNGLSKSCAVRDGWPVMPKWACPIDPGSGSYNMCNVKDYACKVSACINQY